MTGVTRRYTNGEITVLWEPGKCLHSQTCFHGLPQVFDPRKRPWVNIHGAPTEAIAAQVARCPSGALSLVDTTAPAEAGTVPAAAPGPAAGLAVEARPNGPYAVRGPVTVRRPDGRVDRLETGCLLCRCGRSATKPYCDGSHERAGFRG